MTGTLEMSRRSLKGREWDGGAVAEAIKFAFTVDCCGKTIAIFRSEEQAESLRDLIIEDPKVYVTVETWDPGEFYNYVQFEEDQEALV